MWSRLEESACVEGVEDVVFDGGGGALDGVDDGVLTGVLTGVVVVIFSSSDSLPFLRSIISVWRRPIVSLTQVWRVSNHPLRSSDVLTRRRPSLTKLRQTMAVPRLSSHCTAITSAKLTLNKKLPIWVRLVSVAFLKQWR